MLPDKSNKIVLGYPLSAALHAYFDQELNDGRHAKAAKHHQYYKTLYGNRYKENRDLAITISLLYDDIIISGADNPYPDSKKYLINNTYYNPEFGLYLSYQEYQRYDQENQERVLRLLNDSLILSLLGAIPRHSQEQILHEVCSEVILANKYQVPLITLGKRQELAKRITLLEDQRMAGIPKSGRTFMVLDYLQITGILFNPLSIDSFYYLKREKDLRKYASAFVRELEYIHIENREEAKIKLLQLIREARETSSISSKIGGIFETSSNILNVATIIPSASGVIAGTIGEGAGILGKGLSLLDKKHRWYEFGPHVQKLRSLEQIDKALKDIPY